ncbi:zinc finger CCCH domain-containing protein 43 isoform X2 [Arachis duranensis]|uniref:Zinc finger CCCH domain-containing protein 43 isoform X2 n=1 Tax=Arachis duranensis TaxID=130453 RepID=A0A9C6T9F5_ARADU|nr:zinc finger CCCH domain-containing protein 43 isoform X2 [Arachis duranensis]
MGNLQTKWAASTVQPAESNSASSSSSLFTNGSGQQQPPQPPRAPLSSPSDHHQTSQEGALCGDLKGKLELKGEGRVGVEALDQVLNFGQQGVNGDDRDIEGSKRNSWEDDYVNGSVYDGNCVGAEKRKKRGAGRQTKVAKEQSQERQEPSERSGQTECKYYPSLPAAELNFLDLPIRPGEKDCAYYMQHGSCKFGENCKYNHPDPTTGGCDPPPMYDNVGSISFSGVLQQSASSVSSPGIVNKTSPFLPMMLSPTQVSPQDSDWNAYHYQIQVGVDEFAEIPGDSKPKSKRKSYCKKNKLASLPPCNLNDKGLLLRPAPICPSTMSMHPPKYVMNNSTIKTNAYTPRQKQIQDGVDEFAKIPEDSKSKSKGKSRRQKNKLANLPPSTLNDKGLLLRPAPIKPSVMGIHPPTHVMNNPAIKTKASTPRQKQMQVGVDELAEIPGDSKSKSKRKSHHQKNKLASVPPCTLNNKGLPLKPDKSACPEYTCLGICKFGAGCKFAHPSNPPPPLTIHSVYQQSYTNSAGVEVAWMGSSDPTIQQTL